MANYQRFNRHQLFDGELMSYHAETIRRVQSWCIDNDESIFNNVTNALSGIWDGYLYDTLLEDSKALGLPMEDVRRIEDIINIIKDDIAEYGESMTQVW